MTDTRKHLVTIQAKHNAPELVLALLHIKVNLISYLWRRIRPACK